ncbi:MAG: ABC-2 type transport system ATP-binding protein [Halioglobus sp.]|jgi:ABC-2 type transport system ATP-binding protein
MARLSGHPVTSNPMIPALTIENLRKVYDDGFEALKGVSFVVEEGDFYALLGPNGAGKSTTIGIICSLVSKTGGKVSVFDVDIDEDFPAAKKHIGIVPQEFNFNMFEKGIDIVVNQAGYYGLPPALARERAEKYLRELGLWEKRNVPSRMLSGGMKRRLMIARALVHEPRLLILDEPTAGVDIEMRRSMWDFLKSINEAGTTIILTTHYLEEAEALCRNIGIISQGNIVENSSMKDLLRRLHTEVFILDCVEELPQSFTIEGFETQRADAHTLEVAVDKGQHINAVFTQLDLQGIHISSMRSRANRLEEMFVSLVEGGV